jgi:hypothetical protein
MRIVSLQVRGGACALPKTALLPRGGSGVAVGTDVGSGVAVAVRGPHHQRPFTALSATTVGKRS